MTCNTPHNDYPKVLLFCDLAQGHKHDHSCATVAVGIRVHWPNKEQLITDALSDLVKASD